MKKLFEFDKKIRCAGFLVGVDEAGRGPLAGPVVSAAVILKRNLFIKNLNDSKKLKTQTRFAVFNEILNNCIDCQVGIIDNFTIDRINILKATKLSMQLAVKRLNLKPCLVLIDGNQPIDIKIPQITIIDGDTKSASIAAASVIAKVTRDLLMIGYDRYFPNYGFIKHKGYGTKLHIDAINNFGPCQLHRKSFKPVKIYDASITR
ncbi:MAG: ribonuclease HII [Elusimicrobiota bacterium]